MDTICQFYIGSFRTTLLIWHYLLYINCITGSVSLRYLSTAMAYASNGISGWPGTVSRNEYLRRLYSHLRICLASEKHFFSRLSAVMIETGDLMRFVVAFVFEKRSSIYIWVVSGHFSRAIILSCIRVRRSISNVQKINMNHSDSRVFFGKAAQEGAATRQSMRRNRHENKYFFII